jgi:hypothetical protein
VAKKGPKESRPLMLRRSQWEALRNFAPKLDVHLAHLKGIKP